jgi:hypothetical protein
VDVLAARAVSNSFSPSATRSVPLWGAKAPWGFPCMRLRDDPLLREHWPPLWVADVTRALPRHGGFDLQPKNPRKSSQLTKIVGNHSITLPATFAQRITKRDHIRRPPSTIPTKKSTPRIKTPSAVTAMGVSKILATIDPSSSMLTTYG